MDKRKLLITGASSGVGKALTDHLASTFHIIAVARRIERLRSFFEVNPNVSVYPMDLADAGNVERGIKKILDNHGPLYYVINNAGVMIHAPISQLSAQQIQASMMVNALSPTMILRKLLPEMKRSNFGRVINITSGAPLNCSPGYSAYSASKAALNAFTVTIAKEYRANDIKINLMSPGPIRSEMAPDAKIEPVICFPTVDYLLSLSKEGPSGKFFWLGHEVPLYPDLEGVNWLDGTGNEKLRKVL